ncbi:endolytic transglycosylase MltG [Granulicatella sp. zg-ZJ]|uniref:endolytic transglycosylase MltG n=1 Tax=Granulicatella sp. zg-ZJ TaxID=2678504 RepID=UPI0013D72D7A|nr:endolytic transglycosylase MltG [Granulicatella sp. zg-ZJ]MBS4750601.1 endolytic transglycosylase MltG [Carnobacteriaceae bacterium zg-ZUI78]NEW62886.1 endolytic transglycosylase MltG [Granulicatella sp. zg-ZJ]
MSYNKSDLERQTRTRKQRYDRENRISRKIVFIIVTIVLCVLTIGAITAYGAIQYNLQPYDTNNKEKIEVNVSVGSSMKDLAKTLEEMKIIRNATVFNFYLKTKDVGTLKAGNYALSPSMTLDDIIGVLKSGGTSDHAVLATVLVREGDQISQIAETIGKSTPITKDEFLEAIKDDTFVNELVQKYPKLLTSMSKMTDLKYKLEGYLFPATYDYVKDDTAKSMIEKMVKKMDSVMQHYYQVMIDSSKDVHQVLTIASLAEKEGVKTDDRKKIVSVFDNRLQQDMPLQSDISVLYALGEHKELVTFKDLEVDSPYNLYKYKGYGPGPFNSPSEDAISATLNPDKTEYFYFVADVKTGIVYFAKTLQEHEALVEKYVNNK